MKRIILIGMMVSFQGARSLAQALDLEGQAAASLIMNLDNLNRSQVGLRYIPKLSLAQGLGEGSSLKAELALNLSGTGEFGDSWRMSTEGRLRLYRAWLSFSSEQFEARIGLQKINFGSATLLRPLMWFDRMDARDPLGLTTGVYGLLLRYYFLNNVNIWCWGLYGTGDLKGWEFLPSEKGMGEYGGRLQVPVPGGEMGLAYNRRRADASPVAGSTSEDRLGLDGKFDVGIGLWAEASVAREEDDLPGMKYQELVNLGWDYTFSGGLHVMNENFLLRTTRELFGEGGRLPLSAVEADYPLGLLDIVSGIVYWDWEHHNWYRMVNWKRTYDQWQLFLIAFWNPGDYQIYQNAEGTLFSGKGLLVMVVLNH